MPRYGAIIRFISEREAEVDAEDEQEAEREFQQQANAGDLEFTDDSEQLQDIEIVSIWKIGE